jgi:hypothetical protein
MRLEFRRRRAIGPTIMRFTLVFDGELKSNGNPTKKQEIREQFHPQLKELWTNHPALKGLVGRRYVSLDQGGLMWWDEHHSKERVAMRKPRHPGPAGEGPIAEHIDLCEPVAKGPATFLPIVRERIALNCNLKITFLRQEPPGRVYQGGDIDNRLKTLLDALSVPQHDAQVVACSEYPMCCLLEDDSLIAGIDVQTQRLLGRQNANTLHAHLIIEVDVRVTDPRGYNHSFLGD